MSYINTTNGRLSYHRSYFDINQKYIDDEKMSACLKTLATHLDKIGILWGPAFSTLLGIVRNDGYLPWANNICIYILSEDEERFKDELWSIIDSGFELCRYERRGMYYLRKNEQYIRVFVLRKISTDVRHSGGSDFIHEEFLQNTIKWNFKGIRLNVPSKVDEYLSFQYGNWSIPIQYKACEYNRLKKPFKILSQFIQDHLPSALYYRWMILHRKNDFNRFKFLCQKNKIFLPDNVELTYIRRRKHKKILTFGVYDLIHKGHVELFRRSRGLGDHLIVAIQDGEWINKYKDSKVLNSTEDRCFMVKSVRYVDEVTVYKDVDESIKNIDFDVLVTGPDQNHAGFQRAIQWCEDNGKGHIIIGRTAGISSSQLKAKISENINMPKCTQKVAGG